MVSKVLEEAKLAKKLAIDEARGKHLVPEFITFMGKEFDLTPETYVNLSGTAGFAALLNGVSEDFGWIDKNNVKVPMTYDQLKAFVSVVRDTLEYAYYHSSELKVAVQNAKLVEEVEAIPEW